MTFDSCVTNEVLVAIGADADLDGDLSDATEEWRVVPEEGDQTMRFFKIDVEMP